MRRRSLESWSSPFHMPMKDGYCNRSIISFGWRLWSGRYLWLYSCLLHWCSFFGTEYGIHDKIERILNWYKGFNGKVVLLEEVESRKEVLLSTFNYIIILLGHSTIVTYWLSNATKMIIVGRPSPSYPFLFYHWPYIIRTDYWLLRQWI